MFPRLRPDVEGGREDFPGLRIAVQVRHESPEEFEEELSDPAESATPRARLIGTAELVLTCAGTRQKPKLRVERVAEIVVAEGKVPQVVGVGDLDAPSGPAARW